MDRPSDDAITAQMQELASLEEKYPLVGPIEPLSVLLQEFTDASAIGFRSHVESLEKKHYKSFRRTRKDGNCFFRAIAFALFDRIAAWQASDEINLQNATKAAIKALVDSQSLVDAAGYSKLAYEDFYEATIDALKDICTVAASHGQYVDRLVHLFNDDSVSNAVVVYLRCLVSCHVRLHSDDYWPFVMHLAPSLEIYCAHHIDAFGQESEELHIRALSDVLKVAIQVAYLDNDTHTKEIVLHSFDATENNQTFWVKESKPLSLLYRPGHYDILY